MKIGFIAMSGVRAQNADLVAAGLTLPGFIERSKVIASLPSLSLLTLAGLTPERSRSSLRSISSSCSRIEAVRRRRCSGARGTRRATSATTGPGPSRARPRSSAG